MRTFGEYEGGQPAGAVAPASRSRGGAPLGLREVISSEASPGYLAGGVIIAACWRARAMLVIAVSAIAAIPISAAVVSAPSTGELCPVLVPAASIRPPKALPSENATLRTTLLKLIALDVSLLG
jgi:hypothetical protein